jgi:hypothetical protein
MAGPESQNSPRKIKAADKQLAALNLRRAGMGYEEIARRTGYRNASGAWHSVKAALDRMLREPAEDVRQLEVARLDALLAAIWNRAITGDDGDALDRVLKISKRRSELLGLDVKQIKADHSGQVKVTMLNWEDLVRGVPKEDLRDRIDEKLQSIIAGKEASRNGSNGHPDEEEQNP